MIARSVDPRCSAVRSKIGPAVSANRKKEPVLLLDLSTSMDWGAANENSPDYPDPGSRRAIVIGALHGLVRALEDEDSEAATEQAEGSDERGGIMAHGFANGHVEIGDLNSSNLERRLNSIQWGGRTYIMPAWKAALSDYDEELRLSPERPYGYYGRGFEGRYEGRRFEGRGRMEQRGFEGRGSGGGSRGGFRGRR